MLQQEERMRAELEIAASPVAHLALPFCKVPQVAPPVCA